MGKHYRISRRMKRLQMNKARRTRVKRYGSKYMTHRGVRNVTKNLEKARRIKAMRLARGGY